MSEHNPQTQYDCDHCKFSWNCGPACQCNWESKRYKLLPYPSEERKLEVLKAHQEVSKSWTYEMLWPEQSEETIKHGEENRTGT